MAADDSFALSLGAGAFDAFDDETRSAEADLQLKFPSLGTFEWPSLTADVSPMVGALANTDGGAYGYAGVRVDLSLGEHFVLTPSIAAGAYEEGDSRDLGGTFQFRSGLEFAYDVTPSTRVGAAIYHMSNADIYDENPGEESILLRFTFTPRGSAGTD